MIVFNVEKLRDHRHKIVRYVSCSIRKITALIRKSQYLLDYLKVNIAVKHTYYVLCSPECIVGSMECEAIPSKV
jgi:hypothetical protein